MKSDREKILILLIVAPIIVVVALLYFRYFASGEDSGLDSIQTTLIQNRTMLLKEFLSSPGFQILEEFGDLPINIGPAGNNNPF